MCNTCTQLWGWFLTRDAETLFSFSFTTKHIYNVVFTLTLTVKIILADQECYDGEFHYSMCSHYSRIVNILFSVLFTFEANKVFIENTKCSCDLVCVNSAEHVCLKKGIERSLREESRAGSKRSVSVSFYMFEHFRERKKHVNPGLRWCGD